MNGLVNKNNKVLRGKAKDIPLSEIGGAKIKSVLAEMKRALHAEEDGVAIAAPQIGVPLRIFIVAGRAFDISYVDGGEIIKKGGEKTRETAKKKLRDFICINPVITNKSRATAFMVEGCLSLRWLYGSVKRSKKVTIEAYDEHGKRFTRGASGLLAQIFQHETDHLDGILFTDKARDIENIPPEVQKEHEKLHEK
ncbi:MAG: peptide deformylase [Patescibacteria group bacterium]